MRHLLTTAALLLAGSATAQKFDATLGEAPAGFHWQVLPQVKAAMLLPDGWYYKAEGDKAAMTYYLTQEAIGETGEYQTGASLHVVRKVKSKTKQPAPTYAERLMMRTGFGKGQQMLEKSPLALGDRARHWVRYRDAPPDAEVRIVYQLALANGKTDTLYLFTFESPEKEWAEAWLLGQQMVGEAVLDGGM
ncbi:hypothetical protein GCM10023185_35150 [Hymenobacter saemangeumensis]|uniref:DUF1795 domain-containing protein n=1 Tax=Hymenobacter saemangeumensis TaxID=1084522 RepID=A0ABP8IP87_9BACT